MGRQPCCEKFGLKRGPWTIEEDHKLMSFILNNGIQCWRNIPKLAGLLRCGKSCRLRWINYLRPDLKRGALSEIEENQIIELHARLGNRWSKIASHFPGRTDNEIKNHWNTRIKKRLKLQGLDPVTRKPIDQKENDEEKNESEIESNLQNEQQTVLDIPIPIQENAQITEGSEETTKNETGTSYDLISNYELMYTNLDMDLWTMNNQSMDESTSFGKSNISVHDESSMMMQQWVENVDSMLSWDCWFNNQQFFSIFHNS